MAVQSQSLYDSVRRLVAQVISGNETDAVNELWVRFYPRIVEFARQELRGRNYAIEDADDVATNTFLAFYLGATVGAFPDLKTRYDVWQIMQMITSRKVAELARHEGCQMRGGTRLRVEIEDLACSGPSVVQLVAFDDQLEHLLSLLPDDEHLHVALMKISRFTIEQIAVHLNINCSKVRRMLQLIREKWSNELFYGGDQPTRGGCQ